MPTLAWAADPQIASLVDDPDPVPAEGLYSYQMRVDNNSADASINTLLRLTVPSGATFVSATPASQNCAPVGATVVECNLGTLGGLGADVRNITMTWRALGPGPTTVNAAAVLTANNDVNLGNNTQNATTTVISGANLSMGKTSAPNPVVGGSNVTYTLTAANSGPNDSGNLTLTDNLPPSVSFVSASGSGWTCSHSAGVVTCNRPGPHAVGAAIPPVSIVGTVNASGGTVTNSASIAPAVSGGIADPDSANNTATADTTVLPGADVRIAQKTVTSVVPVVAGTNATFQIQPRNGGPATALDVVVSDTLPAGWTFVSASGPNWTCGNAGNVVTCNRASFPTSATDNITIVATAPNNAAVGPTGTTYTNTASISAATTDPNAGNNSGSVNVQVLPDGADVRLAKSKTPNPVAQGSNLTSTLIVTNNGPRTATGPLRVVEVLSGETFVSASGTGWTCTPSGSVVVCDHPNAANLAVNASLPTLTIITNATVAGALSNNACAGASVPAGAGGATPRAPNEGDPNPSNDCASASSSSTAVQPDLAIVKTASTPTGGDKTVSTSESSVTFTLVVTNVSLTPQDATGVRIVDQLPGGPWFGGRSIITTPVVATASAGSSAAMSCTVVDRLITCNQTGGVLRQGESVTVPITLSRPLYDGTFSNTATVGNTAEGDPNSANNSASDVFTIAPIADVEMTGKTVSPTTVRAGENTTYVLSYRNNGLSPALNVVVGDTFSLPPGDAGMTVISIASTAGGSSCNIAAGAQITPASPSFSCTIGTLAYNETQSITLVARPNFQAGNAARVFNNTAAVTTTSIENPAGGDNGNNQRSAVLNVSPAAVDLLVNKTDITDPVPFTIGTTFIHYRVRVNSNGPSFATNVRVNESMTPPAGKRVRFVCDTTTAGGSTCNPVPLCSVANVTSAPGTAIPAFTCSVPAGTAANGAAVGELASGTFKEIFLRFEALDQPAPTGDIFSNVATVSANEPDTFAANNSESEQTTTRQRVDLRVTKTPSLANVTLRQPFNWVVTVVNNGPGNSLQTDLTDTLPAGVEVLAGQPINWTRTLQPGSGTCTRTGQNVACGLGQLDAGGGATITIPARINSFPAGGSLTNSATVDVDPNKTGGIDTPGGNNTGNGTVTVTRSSITGTVFEDRDRAGSNAGSPQAAGSEPRIAGVSVRLTGTDAYGNPVDLTTTTDAGGNYSFTDLSPSDAAGYTVTQTQPTGYVNGPTAPPAPSAGGSYAAGGGAGNSSHAGIVLGGDVVASGYHFPEVRRPTLAGFVYVDSNVNGVRDAGTDTPVAGATVRLLNANDGSVVATATTDAGGVYSFTNLDPLIPYTLEEPLPSNPAALQNGPVNPGQIGGAACASGCTAQPDNPSAGIDRIAAIDLSAGTDGSNFNFGERQLSGISGTVYLDRNGNNSADPSPTDGRLPAVTLRLVQGADCSSGTTLQTTTTDASGNYNFANVVSGSSYLVCQTQPTGYADSATNPGSGASSPASNAIAITSLAPGGSANNNFGERAASLAGSVYVDAGAGAALDNGQRDAGEPGIPGVTVTLTGTDAAGNAVNRSTTTDASGNYRFDDLLAAGPGGYTVGQGAIPPGAGNFADGRDTAGTAAGNTATNDSITGIGLAAGTQATGYLFGELPFAGIAGTVYLDRNRNNGIDAGPTDGRIAGVTIRLVQGADCSSGTTLQTTTTDTSGNYAFSSVAAGQDYLICQTQPAGYGNGTENPGAGAAAAGTNAIAITNLAPGGSAGNHFGERLASISGSVYQDTGLGNAALFDNGVRDPGEPGIASVPVTLTGTDAAGNSVNVTVNTDASGNYRFDNLLAPNPAGYTITEGAIPGSAGSFNDGREAVGNAGGSAAANDVISGVAVAAGAQAAGYTFGELPIATISGSVYVDRNRNNQSDGVPTDAPLPGVTLRLVQGADCTSGAVLQTTTTDASGNFSFANVGVGGSYLICQTQPPGYGNGTENAGAGATSPGANVIAISNLGAAGSSGNRFGERLGSIAGSVYADFSPATPANTNNGVRDGGEAGLAGVTITLNGRDAAGNAVNRSTTTDAGGNYLFDDLPSSDAAGYAIVEGTLPAALGSFNDGRDTAGSAGGGTAVNDQISGVVLGAGVQSTGNNFGELPIVAITGTVYVDRNNSGGIDSLPTDGRLAGVTLTLYQGNGCSGTPVSTATTDANGSYVFSVVSAGLTYTICQTQPTGYQDASTNPGSGGATSGASNAITIPNLPVGGSSNNNFGERSGSLAGNVWLDSNNDGARAGSEPTIAGVTITLTGTDAAGNPISRSTTTDTAGAYRFDDLPGGNYTVTQAAAQPVVGGITTLNGRTNAGFTGGTPTAVTATPSAIAAITLPPGTNSTGNDFGEILPSTIAGRVFNDANNNGAQDIPPDNGLPGVTLVLTGTDDTGAPVTRTVVTGPDGSYRIDGLRPGNYTITQPAQPPGTSNGITRPGSAGGTGTDPSVEPSVIRNITLGAGTTATGYDFAEVPSSGAIAGRVWLDANNNGAVDSGEGGIAGVTIQLTGTDATGAPVSRSTVTDAAGNYSFDGLAPGNYTLNEPQQPAGTVNGLTVPGPLGGTPTPPATVPSSIANIPLGIGQNATANNFGEVPGGEISGRVYADNNNNGQVDNGESGLAGVTITLTGTDDLGNPVNRTVTTAGDGSYAFTGLRPGTYTVTEPTQPPGTLNGITTPGSLGGNATPVGSTPSAISAIVLPVGGRSLNNNFGELANSPDLRVSKSHADARFTVNRSGSYRIVVRNVGEIASSGSYTVSDRLPTGLTLVATPAGNGWACVGAAGAAGFTCTSSTAIAAGATAADAIDVSVNVGAAAAQAGAVNNAVLVEGGGEIDARRPSATERDAFNNNPAALPVCTPAIEHNACRDPTAVQRTAAISGTVWYDIGSGQRVIDAGDRRLPNWGVEIVDVATGNVVGRATTGADGSYRVADLLPGIEYAVRFRDPGSGVVFGYPVNGDAGAGSSGVPCVENNRPTDSASSCVRAGPNPQLTVVLAPGQELPQQSLPVDPSGVVYDSGLRQPVPGSVVTFAPVGACAGWSPATGIVGAGLGGYTIAGDSISMTVGADGFYQYLLTPGSPPSCTYGLTVTPPAGYRFVSNAIPPTNGPLVPPGGAGSVFRVQPQAGPPTAVVGTATTYYLSFTTGSAGAEIIHNHIPLDPDPPLAVSLAKTGDRAVAEVGDSVRYRITVNISAGPRPRQTTVVDRLPAGFTYIAGTATVNDLPIADPGGGVGPRLAFNLGPMPPGNQHVLRYRVRVGVGAQQGDGINRAQAFACGAPAGCVDASFDPILGAVPTNEARHRVRVTGGVFTTDACVLGKIFVDCNNNHLQDREELGIPGVRLVLNDGTTLISDSEGKYSMCGLPPKSHVLKVDGSTLPRGSRLTTSSNRNLGDANSLWLDLKNGELHRADFIEGSCSNTVLEQTKARRAQGEVRGPEVEKKGGPALRFDSKAHGKDAITSPQQGTDGANQRAPKPRTPAPRTDPALPRTEDESNVPVPALPMNRPPPPGRGSALAPDAPASAAGGPNAPR